MNIDRKIFYHLKTNNVTATAKGIFFKLYAYVKNISNSAALSLAKIDDRLYDIKYGTDTFGKITISELKVVGKNKGLGTGYQAARPKSFKKVIRSLHLPIGSVFVDFGSGKGRTLLIASQLGFKRVVGVEFAPVLCDIARKNVEIFFRRSWRRNGNEVIIINGDAIEYDIKEDENVFFLFNPFNELLVAKILSNIISSVQSVPRKIWLVYLNPAHGALIDQTPAFVRIGEFNFPGPGRSYKVWCMYG